MRLSPLVLAALFSPAVLMAQRPTVLQLPPVAKACPVKFSADRQVVGATMQVKAPTGEHGQGLRITFDSKEVKAVEVVVHGYGDAVQAMPAKQSRDGNMTETFRLTADGAQALTNPSLWTKKMVAISWVELTRIDFASGTSWVPRNGAQCTARPSPYVPVNLAK